MWPSARDLAPKVLAGVIQSLDERVQTATKSTNVTDGAKNINRDESGTAVVIDEPQNSTAVLLDEPESSKAVLVDEPKHSKAVTVDKPQSSVDEPQHSSQHTVVVDEPQNGKALQEDKSSEALQLDTDGRVLMNV